MGIEYLFLAFALICGVIAAIGVIIPGANEKPRRGAADYKTIYRDIAPREL